MTCQHRHITWSIFYDKGFCLDCKARIYAKPEDYREPRGPSGEEMLKKEAWQVAVHLAEKRYLDQAAACTQDSYPVIAMQIRDLANVIREASSIATSNSLKGDTDGR